jgi:hypothetical protein
MIWLMELDYNPLIVVAVLGLLVVVLGSWFSPLFPIIAIFLFYRFWFVDWVNLKGNIIFLD